MTPVAPVAVEALTVTVGLLEGGGAARHPCDISKAVDTCRDIVFATPHKATGVTPKGVHKALRRVSSLQGANYVTAELKHHAAGP